MEMKVSGHKKQVHRRGSCSKRLWAKPNGQQWSLRWRAAYIRNNKLQACVCMYMCVLKSSTFYTEAEAVTWNQSLPFGWWVFLASLPQGSRLCFLPAGFPACWHTNSASLHCWVSELWFSSLQQQCLAPSAISLLCPFKENRTEKKISLMLITFT